MNSWSQSMKFSHSNSDLAASVVNGGHYFISKLHVTSVLIFKYEPTQYMQTENLLPRKMNTHFAYYLHIFFVKL